MSVALQVDGLSKSFASRLVVNSVSFSVRKGEILAIMGPNGAGKSTLFSMIAGVHVPDSGQVYINGQKQDNHALWQRAQNGLGYLPQQSVGFGSLSLMDNLRFSAVTQSEIDQALEEFNLTPLKKSVLETLSGGERRRFDLARCVLNNPSVMLLDEPFSGLDPLAIQDMTQRIIRLSQSGIAVIVSDHAIRTTLGLCHEAIILDSGNVMMKAPPKEVQESTLVRDRYLGWD